MQADYKTILDGVILAPGDTLTIHGCKYEVATNRFLSGLNCTNSEIFNVLKINKSEVCGKFGMEKDGGFPYMNSFEALTKLVRHLYELSPFEVGDKVRIKNKVGDSEDYPFSFVEGMEKYTGKFYIITGIYNSSVICKKKNFNGDPHLYRLNDPESYQWHSSMFELVKRAEDYALKNESHPEDGGHGVVPVDEKRVLEYIPGYSRQRKETHITL